MLWRVSPEAIKEPQSSGTANRLLLRVSETIEVFIGVITSSFSSSSAIVNMPLTTGRHLSVLCVPRQLIA